MYDMLELENVNTYYGESHILQGVSFSLGAGEAVAVLGRNGTGKSTTVRTILGFTPPRSGTVHFKGREITGWPPYQIARSGVGLVAQGKRVFPSLTVRENLVLAASGGAWTLERVFELFPNLAERQRQRSSSLSGGEQQMLATARALVLNPTLLVMDEPSQGLSPMVVDQLEQTILQLKQTGMTILLVEQNLSLALTVSDRALVMNKGRIVFDGTSATLEASPAILHQYLGV